VAAAPRPVREIAGKAQVRLCGRFRSLSRKGKRLTVVAMAIARALSAFIWASSHNGRVHSASRDRSTITPFTLLTESAPQKAQLRSPRVKG
jgi:hypothetical protein